MERCPWCEGFDLYRAYHDSERGVISTVVTGIGGGAMAVQYFGLQEWVESVTGLVALGGLIFGCGLPGWAIVCWVFNFIEKNRDAGIDEVAKEVREVL